MTVIPVLRNARLPIKMLLCLKEKKKREREKEKEREKKEKEEEKNVSTWKKSRQAKNSVYSSSSPIALLECSGYTGRVVHTEIAAFNT